MQIIFGSNNIWAQHELLHWFGMDSLEGAQRLDNGIDLHYRNPEETGLYNDKQAHRELKKELGEDAAVNIVLAACHRKSAAILQQISQGGDIGQFRDDIYLICCDVVVRFEGRVRNSPDSLEEAKEFLRSYQGKSLECVAGVLITNVNTQKQLEGVSQTRVFIKDEMIPDHVLDLVVSKDHVHRAPGGFVPDEPMLQPYVARLEGSLDTVMGLPKELTLRLLAEHRFAQDQPSTTTATTTETTTTQNSAPVTTAETTTSSSSLSSISSHIVSSPALPGNGNALSTAYLSDIDMDLSTPVTIGAFDSNSLLDDASRSNDAISDELLS